MKKLLILLCSINFLSGVSFYVDACSSTPFVSTQIKSTPIRYYKELSNVDLDEVANKIQTVDGSSLTVGTSKINDLTNLIQNIVGNSVLIQVNENYYSDVNRPVLLAGNNIYYYSILDSVYTESFLDIAINVVNVNLASVDLVNIKNTIVKVDGSSLTVGISTLADAIALVQTQVGPSVIVSAKDASTTLSKGTTNLDVILTDANYPSKTLETQVDITNINPAYVDLDAVANKIQTVDGSSLIIGTSDMTSVEWIVNSAIANADVDSKINNFSTLKVGDNSISLTLSDHNYPSKTKDLTITLTGVQSNIDLDAIAKSWSTAPLNLEKYISNVWKDPTDKKNSPWTVSEDSFSNGFQKYVDEQIKVPLTVKLKSLGSSGKNEWTWSQNSDGRMLFEDVVVTIINNLDQSQQKDVTIDALVAPAVLDQQEAQAFASTYVPTKLPAYGQTTINDIIKDLMGLIVKNYRFNGLGKDLDIKPTNTNTDPSSLLTPDSGSINITTLSLTITNIFHPEVTPFSIDLKIENIIPDLQPKIDVVPSDIDTTQDVVSNEFKINITKNSEVLAWIKDTYFKNDTSVNVTIDNPDAVLIDAPTPKGDASVTIHIASVQDSTISKQKSIVLHKLWMDFSIYNNKDLKNYNVMVVHIPELFGYNDPTIPDEFLKSLVTKVWVANTTDELISNELVPDKVSMPSGLPLYKLFYKVTDPNHISNFTNSWVTVIFKK